MGFFGKIKDNFTNGGIDIKLEIPASVSLSDQSFLAQIVLQNNSDIPRLIKSTTVTLVEDRTRTLGASLEETNNSATNSSIDLSNSRNEESFTIQPGEIKQLDIAVPLNIGGLMGAMTGSDSPAAAAAANLLGSIGKVVDAVDRNDYKNYVRVNIDVEGIALDPSSQKDILLMRPGEIGGSFGGFNVRI